MKKVIGSIITLVIGGTVYSINQADVVDNFAEETGMSQQQAEQYIDDIEESDLVSFEEIGTSHIIDGEDYISAANEADCINYTYDWETDLLSCAQAIEQFNKIGNDLILLGQSYKKLDTDSTSENDMISTVNLIDIVNSDYDLPIVRSLIEDEDIDEIKRTSSYNRALIQTVLDSSE